MFHIPSEKSRITNHPYLASNSSFGNNGAFLVESPEPGWKLMLVISDTEEWEHVSLHAFKGDKARIPTWKEMCHGKKLCWDAEDVVIQYHPKESDYINMHPFVLHLWRPIGKEIPVPPPDLVGINIENKPS